MPAAPSPEPSEPAEFDRFATSYRALHERNIRASGEAPDYFHRYKIACLKRARAEGPLLDYGCGIGNLTELFVAEFAEVHGFDPSEGSLEIARERAPAAALTSDLGSLPDGHFGSAVLSGVLHHVPPGERRRTLTAVRRKLRPGGRVFVFEHNPLNPLTRKAVADCEFDGDAILLWPWEVRRELGAAGFSDADLEYIVFFPRPLSLLRPLEPRLSWCALGAQTFTCATNPR